MAATAGCSTSCVKGYAVYVLDQPSRARSPHQAETGPQSRNSTERVQQRFTAPERSKLWPQSTLHTQWPGTGVAGDPVFDQFYAQNFPSLTSFPRQQELNRDAGAALLDRIGPGDPADAFAVGHLRLARG
jgi:hypothetical protein